ncbi:MAG: Lrp/AsnC family transcriptional regulator [Gammaproteobacteria bacterium]|nr:Lrp/AsnC family transcriptional regulator [Gammaproteobacteria bacterium]MBU1723952.1 Lrp/AsnC family transcriptional regulator [Gammaproteobacteria bacterium]MBU2007145.1 Lrp/AsnC family transcriptional regulator [Gammaproteobacteria bacterium]
MDTLDRDIINTLQRGFPLSDRPYAEAAAGLGTTEEILLQRLQRLLDNGLLTRFGPLYDAGRMGGSLSLCAMQVPEDCFETVAEQVNALPQVAHNYQRSHALNMWFVLATETPAEQQQVLQHIAQTTGCRVYDMPKEKEYYVGLYLNV